MNLRSLALSLLLSASALALVPSASATDAAAIGSCPEYDIDAGVIGGVRTDYDPATNTCQVWVGLIDADRLCGSIAGVEHRQIREDVTFSGATGGPRTVHLVVNYCAPIVYCTCDPIEIAVLDLLDGISTSAALQPPIYCVMEPCYDPYPPAVSWCDLKAATPGEVPGTGIDVSQRVWGTDSGCDVDVESSWSCAPPSGSMHDLTVGPVHARVLVCDGGLPGTVQRIVETVGPLISA